MADLGVRIIPRRAAQSRQQRKGLGVRNGSKTNHTDMFGGDFMLARASENLEERAGAGSSLARGGPCVAQKIDGFIGQAQTFFDEFGCAENVVLRKILVNNASNRAGGTSVV